MPKITPAHDENDKMLGDKHNLEFIDIFNPNGTLNAEGLHTRAKIDLMSKVGGC
ncbi:MAG: hypothetical protein CM15mP83_6130 [Flavobacteriaceae bacterium]|nr:MAG: hypothetical protein CM15mP83_6130 [Flavobacteriaceae bacterium]